MIIGFIGFGEVNKKLAELLKNEDLITSKEQRSAKTIANIDKAEVKTLPTFKDVAINSDILISATSPKKALETAKEYGKYSNGVYLDLNNISPDTVCEINKHVNLVDGAIIGSINKDFTLFLAAPNTDKLEFLSNYFPIKKISNNIGDASKIKLLRSIYTKATSAILIETFDIANSLNLEDELLDTIALTEGDNFKSSAKSRIENTKNNSQRKKEELLEIIEYFENHDLEMSKATLKKLSNL